MTNKLLIIQHPTKEDDVNDLKAKTSNDKEALASLKTKFEKKVNEGAIKHNETLRYFGNCSFDQVYKNGAISVYPILQELVEALEELDCKTIGDGSIIRKDALSKFNDWLDGANR